MSVGIGGVLLLSAAGLRDRGSVQVPCPYLLAGATALMAAAGAIGARIFFQVPYGELPAALVAAAWPAGAPRLGWAAAG